MITLRQLFHLLTFFICSTTALQGYRQPSREKVRDLQTGVGVVEEFILINAGTEETIVGIQNGTTFNIATLNTFRFNVQALVSGNVESIKFGYNGRTQFHVESGPTFAFCGHFATNFYRCEVLGVGGHAITATPYSGKGLSGEEGSPVKITFTIINEKVIETPTISPTRVTRRCTVPQVRYSEIVVY